MIDDTNTTQETVECGAQDCGKSERDGMQSQLRECQQQVIEWKDKYVRLNADLDNLNRRTAKDRALALYNAQAGLLLPLLSIVDDFERALEQQKNAPLQDGKAFMEGISMIYTAVLKYLTTAGVELMTDYEQFNPEQHEALMHVASDSHTTGQIVSVLQKGYLFKGEVLRHAKVSVAS